MKIFSNDAQRKKDVTGTILVPDFRSLVNSSEDINVQIFLGKSVTIGKLKKALTQKDTLAVFFIGHGSTLRKLLVQLSYKIRVNSIYTCLLGCETNLYRDFFMIGAGKTLITVDSKGNGTTLGSAAQGAFAFINALIGGEMDINNLEQEFLQGFQLKKMLTLKEKNGKKQVLNEGIDIRPKIDVNDRFIR